MLEDMKHDDLVALGYRYHLERHTTLLHAMCELVSDYCVDVLEFDCTCWCPQDDCTCPESDRDAKPYIRDDHDQSNLFDVEQG